MHQKTPSTYTVAIILVIICLVVFLIGGQLLCSTGTDCNVVAFASIFLGIYIGIPLLLALPVLALLNLFKNTQASQPQTVDHPHNDYSKHAPKNKDLKVEYILAFFGVVFLFDIFVMTDYSLFDAVVRFVIKLTGNWTILGIFR